jgi:hypothetical protein
MGRSHSTVERGSRPQSQSRQSKRVCHRPNWPRPSVRASGPGRRPRLESQRLGLRRPGRWAKWSVRDPLGYQQPTKSLIPNAPLRSFSQESAFELAGGMLLLYRIGRRSGATAETIGTSPRMFAERVPPGPPTDSHCTSIGNSSICGCSTSLPIPHPSREGCMGQTEGSHIDDRFLVATDTAHRATTDAAGTPRSDAPPLAAAE